MTAVDVTTRLAESRFTKFHGWLLFWVCLVVTFDMYDLVVYGSVVPVLLQEWALPEADAASIAGLVGSAGFLGMMIGAIGFGMIADRFGRRRVLLISIALFGTAAFLCSFAPDPTWFAALRFLSGLGIGGILPSAIAIVTDYSPRRLTDLLVAVIMCFFSVGGILASLVAIVLIPAFGWHSVYWVAIIPVLLPFVARSFADSPASLHASGRHDELRALVCRATGEPVDPAAPLTVVVPERGAAAPVKALFTDGRATGTVLIWIMFCFCLLLINGLSTWLPGLMVKAGYALGSSLTFSLMLNVGAIVGTIVSGRLADRYGAKRILAPMLVITAVALVLLGMGGAMPVLLGVSALAGACAFGAQSVCYSFAARYYPSFMRSTGIGFASGVGRIGAIVGPMVGGFTVASGLPLQASFLAFAVPGLLAAIASVFIPLVRFDKTGAAATPVTTGDPAR